MSNGERNRTVAIIGVNQEAAALLSNFLGNSHFHIVKVLNPENEDLHELLRIRDLDTIIDTTNDTAVAAELRKMKFPRTDIISGLSAQLLYCTGGEELSNGDVTGYRTRILSSLHEVRRSVFLAKNKEELLKLILSIALHSLSADAGSIMLTDPRKRFLSIEMAEGLENKIVSGTAQRIGKGIAGTVAKTGKPLLIKGKADTALQPFERGDLVSAICSPLIIGNEVVGVLNINSKTKNRVFVEEDLEYLKRLADFTADVIRTSKDYENSTDSTFSLTLLAHARDILNLDYPFEERLNLLLMKIANTLGGEICNYYIYSPDDNLFLVRGSSSFSINLLRDKTIKLNDFFATRVTKTRSQFCFHLQITGNGQRKWYIAQPVKLGESLIGLLFLHLITDRDNLTKEKKALEQIADLLSQEMGKNRSLHVSRMQSIKYSALSEVTFDIARIHNVSQLARIAVSNGCLIMEAESCVFSLFNESVKGFEVLDCYTIKNADHLTQIRELDKIISKKASADGGVLLIPDLHAEGFVSDDQHTRSVMCICIKKKGNPLATLSLYDKTTLDLYDRKSFTKEDEEVFVKYCQQVSKALDSFISFASRL